MKEQRIKLTRTALLTILPILVFGLVGCGENNQELSVEPTEEVIPTEEPTEEVIPTEEPTEVVIPTEEPTQEVTPTQEPTVEVIPTEEVFDLPPIMGKYSVIGTDPDNNNYEDSLEVSAIGGVFQWNWLGREPIGVGVFQEDVVTVAWGESSRCGSISYIIKESGLLVGIYTEKNATKTGRETSIPQGEMGEGIEGAYLANGTTPDGDPYYCTLDITKNGDVYDFRWRCGGGHLYGIGIQRGNIVSVAFTDTPQNCNVFSYLIEEDGTLDGMWALISTSEIGSDVATPDTSE